MTSDKKILSFSQASEKKKKQKKYPPLEIYLLDLLLIDVYPVLAENVDVLVDRDAAVPVLVGLVEQLLDGLRLATVLHALANHESGHLAYLLFSCFVLEKLDKV